MVMSGPVDASLILEQIATGLNHCMIQSGRVNLLYY